MTQLTGQELITLAGLSIAVVTVFLNDLDRQHARSESLRAAVYQRQFDAIIAVWEIVVRQFTAVGDWGAATPGTKEALERELAAREAGQELTIASLRYQC